MRKLGTTRNESFHSCEVVEISRQIQIIWFESSINSKTSILMIANEVSLTEFLEYSEAHGLFVQLLEFDQNYKLVSQAQHTVYIHKLNICCILSLLLSPPPSVHHSFTFLPLFSYLFPILLPFFYSLSFSFSFQNFLRV